MMVARKGIKGPEFNNLAIAGSLGRMRDIVNSNNMKKSDAKGTLGIQKTRLSNQKHAYWNFPMTSTDRANLKTSIKQTKANIKGAKKAIVKNAVKKVLGKK